MVKRSQVLFLQSSNFAGLTLEGRICSLYQVIISVPCISHLAKVYFFTSLEICFPLWIMYIFAINVQKFLKKKLIKTKMIFPPSSSRFALPSLTRPLRGAVPILYLAQDPHRRRAHNSVHRRTFVEHRRTQQQSTGGAAHCAATTTTARRRRRQRSGEARFPQGILSPLSALLSADESLLQARILDHMHDVVQQCTPPQFSNWQYFPCI